MALTDAEPHPAYATIDQYIAGLAAVLPGPRRMRADLLAEARDSLLDAVEAHTATGAPVPEAVRQAVAAFGSYADVAPGYQQELAVAQGRRVAMLVAFALPLLHLLAPLMWWRSPWSGHQASRAYYILANHFDHLSLTGGVLAALVLFGFGWGARYVVDGTRYARLVGYATLAFLAAHGLVGALVFGWSFQQWPGAMAWPPMLIGSVLTIGAFVVAVVNAWRCVMVTRPVSRLMAEVSSVGAAGA